MLPRAFAQRSDGEAHSSQTMLEPVLLEVGAQRVGGPVEQEE
jgi:hypothetical protein